MAVSELPHVPPQLRQRPAGRSGHDRCYRTAACLAPPSGCWSVRHRPFARAARPGGC